MMNDPAVDKARRWHHHLTAVMALVLELLLVMLFQRAHALSALALRSVFYQLQTTLIPNNNTLRLPSSRVLLLDHGL